ncbi:hypothetical protein OS189_06760 [Sulfitobacter sp. F26169L]|uniref:hypothetical protein n=1 Tax=Sulfitobacter sp. F26169L TaxID=2996015 RepID=UPI002260EDE6|nr:hypothetical protein [Sulfitobacter sp. F26169L]MCX7566040.1 hypothetical protein [Sulfitobacter sp. F26169L]
MGGFPPVAVGNLLGVRSRQIFFAGDAHGSAKAGQIYIHVIQSGNSRINSMDDSIGIVRF